MKLDRLLPLGLGGLLGGACALLTIVLALLVNRFLLKPVESLPPREPAVIITWATPVATIPPVMETPLPLADAPPVETPEALAPTVPSEIIPTPFAPIVTPSTEQEPVQVIPPPVAASAGMATRLVIPAIGLDTPIVLAPRQGDTWAVDHLGQTVGHLENTATPGTGGNIVLAGHYTLEETNGGPGPFYQLKRLTPGDVVTIYRGEERFDYIIDGFQTVDEKAVNVTFSTGVPELTLLTCTQWDRTQGEYVKRLIVKGHLL